MQKKHKFFSYPIEFNIFASKIANNKNRKLYQYGFRMYMIIQSISTYAKAEISFRDLIIMQSGIKIIMQCLIR